MVTHSKPTEAKPPSLKKEFLIFISIPVTMIILVAGLLYIPTFLSKPKYNFIYAYCPSYYCDNTFYTTADGSVQEKMEINRDLYSTRSEASLYLHDVKTNSSIKIDLDRAHDFTLSTSNVSPDGYSLKWLDTSSDFFIFGGSYDAHWYLKNGMKKKQMNLESSSYDSHAITLMGWVEK